MQILKIFIKNLEYFWDNEEILGKFKISLLRIVIFCSDK